MDLCREFTEGKYLTEGHEVYPGHHALFRAHFNPVSDGIDSVLSLCHPDISPSGDHLERMGLSEAEKAAVKDDVNRLMERQMTSPQSYFAERKLFQSGPAPLLGRHTPSYLDELKLTQEELMRHLLGIRSRRGRPIRILDLGCGYGHGFKDLVRQKVSDEQGSLGITLPFKVLQDGVSIPMPRPMAGDNIVWANIIHCGVRSHRRFDALFDIYGGRYYHPAIQWRFNGVTQLIPSLHVNNLLNLGGRLFSANHANECTDFLVNNGVWKIHHKKGMALVSEVLRHPRPEELWEWVSGNKKLLP